jgi:hypothetical protein
MRSIRCKTLNIYLLQTNSNFIARNENTYKLTDYSEIMQLGFHIFYYVYLKYDTFARIIAVKDF